MAFNFNALLGGLQNDEDIGGLVSLLRGGNRAAPGQEQASPGAGGLLGSSQPPVDDYPQGIQSSSREPRKGMFGIKGTFRDILGTLGDALSEGTGGKAIYREGRQKEKYADALGDDFTDNPTNAIDRLQQAGFGEEAQKLYQQYQENQLKAQTANATSRYNNVRTEAQARKNIGSLFSTADENTLPIILQNARRLAEKYGIDPSELPTTLIEAKKFGLDPYQSNRLDDYDTSEKRQARNTEDMIRDRKIRQGISQQNANRPRNGPARGASVVDAEILDKVRNGTATPAETKIYEERLRRAPARSGRTRSGPTSTNTSTSDTSSGGTGKYVLRNGKFVKQ